MKKNIGNVLALYPTPAVVVGTEVNGKVNWLLAQKPWIVPIPGTKRIERIEKTSAVQTYSSRPKNWRTSAVIWTTSR